MKSSLKKLQRFALHHGGHHHQHNHNISKQQKRERKPSAGLDELAQASQDMQDIRNCYDSLLSAAAATTNSAYEFSEALRELGSCLLAKTALNDDEESGRVLLMLGKVQFELQKLVDSYRVHVVKTITNPSESLLKELQTVEEMKQQCDDKRDLYKFMLAAHREKGRSKHVKGETVSSQDLQEAQEAYDEEANLFVFRLKSLKQGQSRSLLTQAARHHAAQLNFFRKSVKSLEVVEPHVKLIAEQQHIDYQFGGLQDEYTDNDDDDSDYADDDTSYDSNNEEELSFDYIRKGDQTQISVASRRSSMELDQVGNTSPGTNSEALKESKDDTISLNPVTKISRQSAPISSDKFYFSERIISRPSSTRKSHTYALPTPLDAKGLNSASLGKLLSASQLELNVDQSTQLWYSFPLNSSKFMKEFTDSKPPSTTKSAKAQSVLKESNINSGPINMPPPLAEGLSLPNPHLGSDVKRIRRHAFSGPITNQGWSGKPVLSASDPMASVEFPKAVSRVPTSASSHQPSPRISPTTSPPLISSPKINELHELPRPPRSPARPTRPSSLIGHSAPLIAHSAPLTSRSREVSTNRLSLRSHTASPLPEPPGPMSRSFSIPPSTQRAEVISVAKLLEAPPTSNMSEVTSPPLTPISLMNNIQQR